MTGKRSHVFYTLNCETSALSSPSSGSYQSKRSRHDSPTPEARISLISRFHRYPELKSQIKREPHAPVRHSKFGGFQNSNTSKMKSISSVSDNFTSKMWSLLWDRLVKAKDKAFGSLRFLTKDEEESEIQDDEVVEVVNVKDEPSGAPSIEEDEIMEDVRDGDGNLKGNVENTGDMRTSDVKVVDGDFNSSQASRSSISNENSMVLSAEKMLDSLSLTGRDSMELFPYNKLNDVESKYQNLDSLQLEIEINEMQEALQRSRMQRKVEGDAGASEDTFREMVAQACKPLTKDEENQVTYALSNYQRQKLLVTHESSNIDITGDLLQCLRPQMWLNDEVINLYLELLKERENRDAQKFLKCHFFNTFFYKKLISGKDGYNFQSVRRWTLHRKLGYFIFDCDMIFVPIHKEIHWSLAVINKKEEKFQYLDSLGHADSHVMEILARYYVDEVKEKNGKEINVSLWKHEFVEDLPKQMNGYDCGVFMIKYADFYSRGIGLCFKQEHMPYFRRRTANEILKLKAE